MCGNAEAEYQSEGYNLCENCYQSKVQNAEIENSSDYDVDNTVTSSDPNATMGERNALGSAIEYLNVMPFSYSGLIEQLEYEGYSNSEATYAADNCGADWYEQAVLAAKGYLDAMSFSRQGLIAQLEFEGFTHDQAVYGVEQNGYVDSDVNKPENGEMQDSDSELSFSIPEEALAASSIDTTNMSEDMKTWVTLMSSLLLSSCDEIHCSFDGETLYMVGGMTALESSGEANFDEFRDAIAPITATPNSAIPEADHIVIAIANDLINPTTYFIAKDGQVDSSAFAG